MKKSIKMGVKPLAMATALAAGTTVSMMATALPGGDTLGALAGVVNESICQQSVDMSIDVSGIRTVTTGTGICQLRTLPPTQGLRLSESSPAGAVVVDSSALVGAGGELYETYVGGERSGVTLLTPNRALATSRSVSFSSSATEPSLAYDFSATVQPATGLQPEWLTGSYRLVTRTHNFATMANGLEHSLNSAEPFGVQANPALTERNFTVNMDVTFNGDGTCSIDDIDNHLSGQIKKDPTFDLWGLFFSGEQDVNCQAGLYDTDSNPLTPDEFVGCSQNDGDNYALAATIHTGTNYAGTQDDEVDWMDAQGNGAGAQDAGCTYVTSPGKVDVTYALDYGPLNEVNGGKTWTVSYDVSADLRYLVSDGDSIVEHTTAMSDTGANGGVVQNKGGIQIGVRKGTNSFEGNTYLVNLLQVTSASRTPNTASYENGLTPVYQKEECISRAAVTLGASGSCTLAGVVSTCAGRSSDGYEESDYNANDGNINDSLEVFEGAPNPAPTCAWSGSAADLTVTVDQLDPEGNPWSVVYTGAVSDNGEALVMQGIVTVGMAAPDVENPPLLNGQKFNLIGFMVGQQYQGDLNGNADADADTNLAEFTWSKDVTPAGGAVRSDYDASGTSDVYWTNATTGTTQIWSNGQKSVASFPGAMPSGAVYVGSGDFDGDGSADALFHNASTLATVVWPASVRSNATYPGKGSTGFAVQAVCDVTGDGLSDIIWRNQTTGANQIWPSGVKANVTYPGTLAASFSVVACADFDGSGSADIFFRDTTSGSNQIWPSGVKANVTYPGTYLVATSDVVDAGDFDGNGTADLLWFKADTGTTIIWNGGLKSAAAYPGTTGAYTPQVVGDYSGDGKADIFLKNLTTGGTAIWPDAVKASAVYPGAQSNLDWVVKK